MPAERRALRQVDARFTALVIEQAQLDALRHLGKQGEVGARAVEIGAERIGLAWPNLHSHSDWNPYILLPGGHGFSRAQHRSVSNEASYLIDSQTKLQFPCRRDHGKLRT
jgi:hypothetical protein